MATAPTVTVMILVSMQFSAVMANINLIFPVLPYVLLYAGLVSLNLRLAGMMPSVSS